MNQTESIKAYLEEKASRHKIAYTKIDKYQELIEGYFEFMESKTKFCSDCKYLDTSVDSTPCSTCFKDISKPNWQKA